MASLRLVLCFVASAGYADQRFLKRSNANNASKTEGSTYVDERILLADRTPCLALLMFTLNPSFATYRTQLPRQLVGGFKCSHHSHKRIGNPTLGLRGLLHSLAIFAVLNTAQPAFAENELAVLAKEKSTAELVQPGCIAEKCKAEMEACAADKDCTKGMLCTAKCMGSTKCTVGCFARYSDTTLEKVLQCTVEDSNCIQIGTVARGPDSALDAPKPPKPLIEATPETLSGRWYKVIGFNPNYDCYDCQQNTFYVDKTKKLMKQGFRERWTDITSNTVTVEVEYSMPRERVATPPTTYSSSVFEKLEFDTEPGSVRTAHTEGRMFGLTFWENWYIIGQNSEQEPEFRFVWYTGKTLQNRYEGAFVYAREPRIPEEALPSIFKIAREAGLDPMNSCPIDNTCFLKPDSSSQGSPPQRSSAIPLENP